jgi:carboxypeptidase family protein
MKALALVALVVVLGAGALYFALASGGERGGRTAAPVRATPARATEPEPQRESAPQPAPARKPSAAPTRQSVAAGDAPGARTILEGIVIGDGSPVPGADVAVLRREVVLGEATSDAQGRFRVECEPQTASTVLRVRARGFVATERPLAARPVGGTQQLGNLRVMRGRRVAGRVVDGRGAGIPDAEVRLEPSTSGSDVLVGRGTTGPDGSFEIAEGPPGALLASARAKGFGERTIPYTVGETPLVIQLEPGVELVLALRGPRGQPVAGAEVTIQSQSETLAAKRSAESDENGHVLFEGLGTRMWTVRVSHPDYRPTGRSQVEASGREEVLECLPWPGIEGIVRAPGGKPPPPGTRVQALPASAPSDRVSGIEGGKEVAADGSFRIGGLRAGAWRVRVSAPGFASSSSGPLTLGIEGDGYAGTIELAAGGRLVCALRLAGQPAAGSEVELFLTQPTPAQLWALASSRGAGLGKRVTSGPDGNAVLENLAEGRVWIAAYADGCPPLSSGPHVVTLDPSPAPILMELVRGARVLGVVRDKNGAPLARAQLRVIESAGRLGFPLTLVTEEDGRYTSTWLPAGQYTVEAFSPEDANRRSGVQDVTLESGADRTLDLTL